MKGSEVGQTPVRPCCGHSPPFRFEQIHVVIGKSAVFHSAALGARIKLLRERLVWDDVAFAIICQVSQSDGHGTWVFRRMGKFPELKGY
jgi:hypothetical protein